jgi:DNA-binding NarL/FixJ family response regulator
MIGSAAPARIIVVDDHPIVRLGVRQLINADRGLSVCAEAASAQDALLAVNQADPDLAIIDLSLGETTGLELIRELHARKPDLPILVLSVHDGLLFAERALRAGARGYITKREAVGGLITAIRNVLSGRLHMSADMPQDVIERVAREPADERIGSLTDREFAVFEMIGLGISTAAIARRLAISGKTVETYRANIKTKLNLSTGTDLVRCATVWAGRNLTVRGPGRSA